MLTLVLVSWFEELLGRKWLNHRLLNAHIQFGFPASAVIPAGFKFILATLRHYVWVARNWWQFEGTRPDPQVLAVKIKYNFRFVSEALTLDAFRPCPCEHTPDISGQCLS